MWLPGATDSGVVTPPNVIGLPQVGPSMFPENKLPSAGEEAPGSRTFLTAMVPLLQSLRLVEKVLVATLEAPLVTPIAIGAAAPKLAVTVLLTV